MGSNSFNNKLSTTLAVVTILTLTFQSLCHAQDSNPSRTGKTITTNLTGFTVPFAIDNQHGEYIEVHLYVSRDQGQSWKYHAKKEVNADGFAFRTQGDGEYWFALKSLNRDRQLVPSGQVTNPELRIIVDSQKPEIEFHLDADAAGRVITSWRIQDQNLDKDSLKISHRDASPANRSDQNEGWKPVSFQTNATTRNGSFVDRVAWWPASNSRRIEVQLSVTDNAGNTSVASRTLTLKRTTVQNSSSNSTTIANRFPSPPRPAARQAATAKTNKTSNANKPSNVVCENGVCRIVNEPATKEASSSWRRGVFQNANKSAQPASYGRSSQNSNAANRWNRQVASRPSVGSPAENIAPPVPANYQPMREQFAATAPPSPFSSNGGAAASVEPNPIVKDTIEWKSKSTNLGSQSLASAASTADRNNFPSTRPERKVLNLNRSNDRFKNVPVVQQRNIVPQTNQTNQRLAESSISEQGDMIVSQSTTFGRGKPQVQSYQSATQPEEQPQSFNQAYSQTQQSQTPSFARQPIGESNYQPASYPVPGSNIDRTPFKGPHNEHLSANSLHVKTRRFNLNYDIKAVNPSGVGRVNLWVTQDGGASWKSWLTDPDNQSPFPVEVSEEGVYGFRVVVNSKDGIAGKPPMANDTPDVWVQVDLSTPKVALTSAPYGSGKDTGKLILHWEAYDQFLTERPISLSYSPTENGPWTAIADRLRNTGSYAWKVPPQVSEQVYLKIEASDKSKNVGVFQTSSPIDISGLVPRGRIYSVEPIQ